MIETDQINRGILIASGILVVGFIGYLLLRKREVTQDVDHYDLVGSKPIVTYKKESKQTPKTDEIVTENPSTEKQVLSVVKDDTTPKVEDSNAIKIAVENETMSKEVASVALDEVTPEQKQVFIAPPTAVNTKQPPIAIGEVNDEFPLKLGSKGKRVFEVKAYLLKNYGALGVVTDQYDQLTEERVKRFLKVDQISEALFHKRRIGQPRKSK